MADEGFDRVSKDAGLRAVLKTARSWGVSPRRFMGWEPARTFTPVYVNGVLIRVVESCEPEWDDESRDLAIGFAMWETDLCPGCNSPMSETLLAENEGRYVARAALRCHSCTAREQASDVMADAPQPSALFIPVELLGADRADRNEDQGSGASDRGIGPD